MKLFRDIRLRVSSFFRKLTSKVLWRPEQITAEVKRAHELAGANLIIELNQELEAEEFGWKQSRIDIPESWKTAGIKMQKGKIFITTESSVYYIDQYNMGQLSFEILNNNISSDEELIETWQRYASYT